MPATTLTARVKLLRATSITSMVSHDLPRIHGAIGTLDLALADGATVTATRVDAGGSGSGTVYTDDRGIPYATFGASPLAAGTWDLVV